MAVAAVCKAVKATSNGAFSHEYPVDYAVPLLTIQLCLILAVSRIFSVLLKPMRQPRVIAEILGGIVLGASAFGKIPHFTAHIFPDWSSTVLNSFANVGLLFFLFMVGLELDIRSLRQTGKSSLFIAITGISLPFGMGVGASIAIRHIMDLKSDFWAFVVFIGVAMSITAFPVLARILAERKLLTTDVGQIAMSAAAVNDVMAWILLALAIALSASDTGTEVVAWILLSGIAFLVVMFVVIRPLLAILGRQIVDNEPMPEWIVTVTLVGVLLSGFCTDTIGIHGIFGAFVFGLVMPKDGPFASLIIEKIEDITTIVLLPLYFASSGLKVKFEAMTNSSIGVTFLVIGVACVGKIGGTFFAALASKVPVRKSLVLGILMNTKGLVELIVLNIGLQRGVIDQELYTVMVIMALVTTFMTTPLVMLLYAPAREKIPYTHKTVEGEQTTGLRMLVCVHGMKTIPPMLNLMELLRGTRKYPLKAFMLHLVEFSERSSAIMMVTRARKDGKPFWSKEAEQEGRDQVAVVFQAYARLSKVTVEAMTAISQFFNMHEDICGTAADRRANLIILPYHKTMDGEGRFDLGNPGFQSVNRRIMREAPCSVAVLVDAGLGGPTQLAPGSVAHRIGVLFYGGPDDREALAVALRMAEHPGVAVTVFRFVARDSEDLVAALAVKGTGVNQEGGGLNGSFLVANDFDREAKLDSLALATIAKAPALVTKEEKEKDKEKDKDSSDGTGKDKKPPQLGGVVLEERVVDDALTAALEVAKDGYDIVIVGRGQRPSPLVAMVTDASQTPISAKQMEAYPGLGPVGDALVSREEELMTSILVVQQHDPASVKKHKLGVTGWVKGDGNGKEENGMENKAAEQI